ncbi:hypothetical protein SKAU_G00298350 [Synaphobranchus kaupii]|uniref:Uncharacterized protein n=1 Tax=Synaphobranchus kaupii TaxID=118154 RepID=A0A9Q1IM20_SYNKA|nr:hypothetical protein SKAU_G00298350 [Synaphobranchus kaupii]
MARDPAQREWCRSCCLGTAQSTTRDQDTTTPTCGDPHLSPSTPPPTLIQHSVPGDPCAEGVHRSPLATAPTPPIDHQWTKACHHACNLCSLSLSLPLSLSLILSLAPPSLLPSVQSLCFLSHKDNCT